MSTHSITIAELLYTRSSPVLIQFLHCHAPEVSILTCRWTIGPQLSSCSKNETARQSKPINSWYTYDQSWQVTLEINPLPCSRSMTTTIRHIISSMAAVILHRLLKRHKEPSSWTAFIDFRQPSWVRQLKVTAITRLQVLVECLVIMSHTQTQALWVTWSTSKRVTVVRTLPSS